MYILVSDGDVPWFRMMVCNGMITPLLVTINCYQPFVDMVIIHELILLTICDASQWLMISNCGLQRPAIVTSDVVNKRGYKPATTNQSPLFLRIGEVSELPWFFEWDSQLSTRIALGTPVILHESNDHPVGWRHIQGSTIGAGGYTNHCRPCRQPG